MCFRSPVLAEQDRARCKSRRHAWSVNRRRKIALAPEWPWRETSEWPPARSPEGNNSQGHWRSLKGWIFDEARARARAPLRIMLMQTRELAAGHDDESLAYEGAALFLDSEFAIRRLDHLSARVYSNSEKLPLMIKLKVCSNKHLICDTPCTSQDRQEMSTNSQIPRESSSLITLHANDAVTGSNYNAVNATRMQATNVRVHFSALHPTGDISWGCNITCRHMGMIYSYSPLFSEMKSASVVPGLKSVVPEWSFAVGFPVTKMSRRDCARPRRCVAREEV